MDGPGPGRRTRSLGCSAREHGRENCARFAASCRSAGNFYCGYGGIAVGRRLILRAFSKTTTVRCARWQTARNCGHCGAQTMVKPRFSEILMTPKNELGGSSMVTIATISVLVGATLGLRFKVMILVPATMVMVGAVALAHVGTGSGLWPIAGKMMLAVVALQLSYVAGQYLRCAARTGFPFLKTLATGKPPDVPSPSSAPTVLWSPPSAPTAAGRTTRSLAYHDGA